ncbi:MAG: FAD-binding protein [Leptospiraceae bacterium]|nr:FAD-binding protein [Leptospiraceae bacterium]
MTYLLLTFKGRIDRETFWLCNIFMWSNFFILFKFLEFLFGLTGTWVIYPLMLWGLLAVATKRYHDVGKSGLWFWLILIPILGQGYVFLELAFRQGKDENNEFGTVPGSEIDYYKNNLGEEIPHLRSGEVIINDVTKLNPILVSKVIRPQSVDEVQVVVRSSELPISVGGGRFSMGGQTASDRTLHLDMRGLNKIVAFNEKERFIRVQAGARWCDIQHFIDGFNLSVKIMQTYANFTVGGSVSVNCHGRYMGLGPLVLSIRAIDIVLHDGTLMKTSRKENSEIFYATIGGYGALGVIVEVELDLSENLLVKRVSKKLNVGAYLQFFKYMIREDKKAIFHNADIYPPEYKNIRAVTWEFTADKPTVKKRLMPLRASYPIHRYFLWEFTETPFGKWRREYLIEPFLYIKKIVHYKNYEAGYDVAELEPLSRDNTTYVLQEYFVPIDEFEAFVEKMTDILKRHKVNMVNISIRHAKEDTESYLSWAKTEVFAFVMYYKQRVKDHDKTRVSVWTRELVDAATSLGGSYYLPYQVHATKEQFIKAYPKALKLFDLKKSLDPDFKFRNVIWDTYYQKKEEVPLPKDSKFFSVMSKTEYSDKMYRFLQVVFHLYPEDKFHRLIHSGMQKFKTDNEIYLYLKDNLPSIKTFLGDLTYSVPSLFTQKNEMTRQILVHLAGQNKINGYLEIGTTGRYISVLKKQIQFSGNIYLTNEFAPTNSPADILERAGFAQHGKFIPLDDYAALDKIIARESLELVTCLIGLHHIKLDKLYDYINSIHRILKSGGKFILRDHDVKNIEMDEFVSLVHTVFNAGTGMSLEYEKNDFKRFRSIDEWISILEKMGFKHSGEKLLQKNDPTDNTLIVFTKK